LKSNSVLIVLLTFITSAILLTVIQPPFNIAPLAWVALVPFILACRPDAKAKELYITAYLVSAVYWLGNLYWMGFVTPMGWVTFCLYTALLWPLLVFCLRTARAKKIPLFLAVPILVVGVERLQGLFMGGFFWRYLSHSQYANTTLIQIADIFGATGISFLIAMVNGLVAELIIARKNCLKPLNILKTAIVLAAITAAVLYGQWRINQSDKYIEIGPLVASVQSNVPQSVKESQLEDTLILDELLEASKAASKTNPELTIWPETMVQGVLDKRVLKLLDPSTSHRIFDDILKAHAKNIGFLLVGATGGKPFLKKDMSIELVEKYNSAFLYQPDGTQADKQYNKIHLVPFGEVVPFKQSAPWLHGLLMKFTPYDYDYTLDYGTEYTIFEIKTRSTDRSQQSRQQQRTYKFGTMICYEGTIPSIARNFTLDNQSKKRIDWLVNISNDGWFVRFKNKQAYPSTELSQHAIACVFRAVENRLAVVRSVNTGVSCLIDTLGQVKNEFIAGNLPKKAMARTGMAGWFADTVPIDKRISFFSRYGQWLDLCCEAGLILFIIAGIVRLKTKSGSKK
jgi:apolipoprotein N-acyltransferase